MSCFFYRTGNLLAFSSGTLAVKSSSNSVCLYLLLIPLINQMKQFISVQTSKYLFVKFSSVWLDIFFLFESVKICTSVLQVFPSFLLNNTQATCSQLYSLLLLYECSFFMFIWHHQTFTYKFRCREQSIIIFAKSFYYYFCIYDSEISTLKVQRFSLK